MFLVEFKGDVLIKGVKGVRNRWMLLLDICP